MNRLKQLRKEKHLTLDDITEKTKINRGTYNNYENDKTKPKPETWQTLADFYGVSVPYLQGAMYCKKCCNYFFEEKHYNYCPYCGILIKNEDK